MATADNSTSASCDRNGLFFDGVSVSGVSAALMNPLSFSTMNYVEENKSDVSFASMGGSVSVAFPAVDEETMVDSRRPPVAVGPAPSY